MTDLDLDAALQRGRQHELAGALAQAEQAYRGVLDAVRGSGSALEREVTKNMARLCANDGREFEALTLATHARDLAARAGDPWRRVLAEEQIANALDGIEDYERIPAVIDSIEREIDDVEPAEARQLRLLVALHRARLAANRGDVPRALEEFARANEASRAFQGKPLSRRLEWFVNVVALNNAGRFAAVQPWLERIPPSDGILRRELEYAEQSVRCLLAVRPEPDGLAAAAALLSGLRDAPPGTMGPAWRLRVAADLGTRLAVVAGGADLARAAWDLAGHAILVRLRQIEDCMRALPELSSARSEVFDLLTDYRDRFRGRHSQLLREVAASRPWPPVDSSLIAVDAGMAVVCAWCTRVRTTEGKWVPIRQFLPDQGEAFALSHGICRACWERFEVDLAAYERERDLE